ncbi:hypothetical protein BC829DRAFT_456063 [Chytridium lagenaria]|nr:hypothetical protein BC829DRAFT_456063 [Chytridium lagenaria]
MLEVDLDIIETVFRTTHRFRSSTEFITHILFLISPEHSNYRNCRCVLCKGTDGKPILYPSSSSPSQMEQPLINEVTPDHIADFSDNNSVQSSDNDVSIHLSEPESLLKGGRRARSEEGRRPSRRNRGGQGGRRRLLLLSLNLRREEPKEERKMGRGRPKKDAPEDEDELQMKDGNKKRMGTGKVERTSVKKARLQKGQGAKGIALKRGAKEETEETYEIEDDDEDIFDLDVDSSKLGATNRRGQSKRASGREAKASISPRNTLESTAMRRDPTPPEEDDEDVFQPPKGHNIRKNHFPSLKEVKRPKFGQPNKPRKGTKTHVLTPSEKAYDIDSSVESLPDTDSHVPTKPSYRPAYRCNDVVWIKAMMSLPSYPKIIRVKRKGMQDVVVDLTKFVGTNILWPCVVREVFTRPPFHDVLAWGLKFHSDGVASSSMVAQTLSTIQDDSYPPVYQVVPISSHDLIVNVDEAHLFPLASEEINEVFKHFTERDIGGLSHSSNSDDALDADPLLIEYVRAVVSAKHHAFTAYNLIGEHSIVSNRIGDEELNEWTFRVLQMGAEVIHLGDIVRVRSSVVKELFRIPQHPQQIDAIRTEELLMEVLYLIEDRSGMVMVEGVCCHVEDLEEAPDLQEPLKVRRTRLSHDRTRLLYGVRTPIKVNDLKISRGPKNGGNSAVFQRIKVKMDDVLGRFYGHIPDMVTDCRLGTKFEGKGSWGKGHFQIQ